MARVHYQALTLHGVRVIDSDTIEAWVEITSELRQKWRIRLEHVEGGEKHEPEGPRGYHLLCEAFSSVGDGESWFIGAENKKDNHGRHVGDIGSYRWPSLKARLLTNGHHWHRTAYRQQPKPSSV